MIAGDREQPVTPSPTPSAAEPSRSPRLGLARGRPPLALGGFLSRFWPDELGWSAFSPRSLTQREFSIHSAALLLMATFFASAVLGAARQVLLGAHFGANETTGAFGAASRLPDVLFTLVAGGALSSAFLPVLAAARAASGNTAAWRLFAMVLNSLIVTLTIVSVIGFVVAPWIVETVLVPGYSAQGQHLATDLTRLMLLQPVILGAGTVMTAWLNSENRFFLPAVGVASHNVGILLGIAAAMLWPGIGIWGPAWGVVGGAVLQVGLTALGMARSNALAHWTPRIDLGDRGLREVATLLVPNGVSMLVNYLGWVVESSFGSRAHDNATLPALHNAWLVAGLAVTLLGAAIGQAVFPRLAARAAAGDRAGFRLLLRRVALVAVLGSLPLVAALLVGGGPLVSLLFQHGAYDADATHLTRQLLVGYAVGLPFYIGTEIASRAVLATRDARTPLLTNTLQLLLRGGLMALFLAVWGVVGIPLAYAVASAVESVLLFGFAWRRANALDRPSTVM